MKKLPISIVLVVHNEEKNIKTCLDSVRGIADEIIVIHDGRCTDRTIQIASLYTKKIYIRKFNSTAQLHRVFSYTIAKNEWILQLDADEYLSDDLRKELPNLVLSNYSIINVRWVTANSNNQSYYLYKGILFRKSECYYIGAISEYVKPFDPKKVLNINKVLFHYPGDDNWIIKINSKKSKNRLKIHTKLLLTDFNKIVKWNYPYKDWDYPTNVRRKYPLIFGCLLSIPIHLISAIRQFNKPGFKYYLIHSYRVGLYLTILYWNYFIKKNHELIFKRE